MIGTHHHTPGYAATLDAERGERGRRLPDPSDLEQLVHAAARGEEAAWDSLVRRFTRRLTRLARAHRVSAQDADDIVQLSFVRLYEQLHTLRDPNALPAWLDTTARRESLRRLRQMARERPLDAGIVENLAALPQPEEVLIDRELAAELRAAVERLPEHQRTLIEALYSEEPSSYEEISRTHGIPIGGIGPTRGRALKRLRDDEHLAQLAAEYVAEQADDGAAVYTTRARRSGHVTALGM